MRCRQRLVNVVAVAVVVEELEPGGGDTTESSELGLAGHFQVLTKSISCCLPSPRSSALMLGRSQDRQAPGTGWSIHNLESRDGRLFLFFFFFFSSIECFGNGIRY